MNDEEFDALVEQFISRDEDQVTLSTFVQVMTDIAEERKQREIELTGRLVDGEVIFDTPTPLLVGKNTIYIGDTKVTLKLRLDKTEEAGSGIET